MQPVLATGASLSMALFSKSMDVKLMNNADAETVHPLIRTHPGTGRKSLFISGIAIRRLEGMTVEESRPILSFLKKHAIRPENTCQFRWRKGSVTVMPGETGFENHNIIVNGSKSFMVIVCLLADG